MEKNLTTKLHKLEEVLEKACRGTSFCLHHIENGIISLNSDLGGEDIWEEFAYECDDEPHYILHDIAKSLRDYDPEEDFNLWYGAKRGEPSNPGELWKHCEDKEEDYNELAKRIDKEAMSL